MILKQRNEKLTAYLEETEYINYSHPAIKEKAKELFDSLFLEVGIVKAAYEYVRDNIYHSNDIGGRLVTKTASEVLLHKQGMCYAKTMLLAGLLRYKGIPTGFCYQRLAAQTKNDYEHSIHAVNAVYLSSFKQWVRLDHRGNVDGRNAQFYPDNPLREQLVYSVRKEFGEIEFADIYAQHPSCVMQPLLISDDCQIMMQYHLPNTLS